MTTAKEAKTGRTEEPHGGNVGAGGIGQPEARPKRPLGSNQKNTRRTKRCRGNQHPQYTKPGWRERHSRDKGGGQRHAAVRCANVLLPVGLQAESEGCGRQRYSGERAEGAPIQPRGQVPIVAHESARVTKSEQRPHSPQAK